MSKVNLVQTERVNRELKRAWKAYVRDLHDRGIKLGPKNVAAEMERAFFWGTVVSAILIHTQRTEKDETPNGLN